MMGTKSKRKKEFLAKHPICCFCGGEAPSQERDHIPSRVLFDDRHWPEGYEFPACKFCNRKTRHDEQVVAVLSRLYPDPITEEGKKEVCERIRAVAYNYPALLEEMKPSSRQVENALEKYGIKKPEGLTTADLPFLNVSGPLVNGAVENFGRKLFLALYYFHTSKILPKQGGVVIRWYSSLQIEYDEIPKELARHVSIFPKLERSRMDLSDQFFYRYRVTDDYQKGVFLAFFRRSFAIVGFVNENAATFALPEGATILRPYERQNVHSA